MSEREQGGSRAESYKDFTHHPREDPIWQDIYRMPKVGSYWVWVSPDTEMGLWEVYRIARPAPKKHPNQVQFDALRHIKGTEHKAKKARIHIHDWYGYVIEGTMRQVSKEDAGLHLMGDLL